MFERIDRAVDAGALAVPDAEHAIDLGAGKQADLLAAPDGGRSQVLVQAGDEGDVVLLEVRLRAPQRVVVHAERGTTIARDETAGVEALKPVAFALQHGQPNQRLRAGQEDPLRFEPVFVVQLDLHQRHFRSPRLSFGVGVCAAGGIAAARRELRQSRAWAGEVNTASRIRGAPASHGCLWRTPWLQTHSTPRLQRRPRR
ncbi:hypothetical protein ACVW0J_008432 [Bradyrhizobium sp. i1.7.7]